MNEALKTKLDEKARALGFAKMRVARAKGLDFSDDLAHFLRENYHGDMAWMAEREAWRASPKALWQDVRSIIVLAETYDGSAANAHIDAPEIGVISTYARGHDYHEIVKKRLKALGRWFIEEGGGEIKVFVDTAPVMEKPIAAAAGLGWQGKHTNLLARDLGNWFFLGVIYTTIELPPDIPVAPRCGSCTSCIDVCPTRAFPQPYQLDARRCISYLTIEYKGAWANEFRKAMGNRIYGCDDCLAACPWNKYAVQSHDARLAARDALVAPKLIDLLQLDDAQFRTLFSKSPIKRIGWAQFMRNCLYAAGNAKSEALRPYIEAFVSNENDVLRDAASWALAEYER